MGCGVIAAVIASSGRAFGFGDGQSRRVGPIYGDDARKRILPIRHCPAVTGVADLSANPASDGSIPHDLQPHPNAGISLSKSLRLVIAFELPGGDVNRFQDSKLAVFVGFTGGGAGAVGNSGSSGKGRSCLLANSACMRSTVRRSTTRSIRARDVVSSAFSAATPAIFA
ncbi:MAG: hypothetical protein ACRYGM_01915 [Janthinobacterium lividum]